MGKREVRIVVVPKWATAVLLVTTSAAMIALVSALSGRAYASEPLSVRDLVTRIMERSPHAALVAMMPLAANALLFVPWGFFAFLVLDRSGRSRAMAYTITILGGALFAIAISAWQSLLPMRLTTIADSIANVAGTFAGAAAAHLRKRLRVRFDA
jgi:glycopeptide antibiotics resistance protein